jgi:hypothetical protein
VTIFVLDVSCLLISPSVPYSVLLGDVGDYDCSSLRKKEARQMVVANKSRVEKIHSFFHSQEA